MPGDQRAAGFGAFFRQYTRTWYHAVATAALTAFGMLTFVNKLFAVVALLAYILPPVVLYVRSPRGTVTSEARDSNGGTTDGTNPGAEGGTDSGTEDEASQREPGVETENREQASSTDRPAADRPWSAATVPTDETLTDVARLGERAYAVGADGSLLCGTESGWDVVVADGPDADGAALTGVATVGDGGVWFAGDGGAVGRFDPSTGRHVSHSAPNGDTSNLTAIAVTGSEGVETVLLADGSGGLRRGRYHDRTVAWEEPVTPGSGSSLCAVTFTPDAVGYAADTDQSVFETTDEGRTFRTIGLDGGATPTDIAAATRDRCLVSDDQGAVVRYDGRQWTAEQVADGALYGIATADDAALACGDDGAVFERAEGAVDWTRAVTPATGMLNAVASDGESAVAVGDAGTIVERE